MALALMPMDTVETSFFDLRVELDVRLKQELRQLILYFDEYWMTEIPIEMWNFSRYRQRTNNSCEGIIADFLRIWWKPVYLGFHSRLNRRIERAHSNIWSFIKCIMTEENRVKHMYAQINAGNERRPCSSAQNEMEKQLKNLYERYDSQELNSTQLLHQLSLLMAKKK